MPAVGCTALTAAASELVPMSVMQLVPHLQVLLCPQENIDAAVAVRAYPSILCYILEIESLLAMCCDTVLHHNVRVTVCVVVCCATLSE